jgi:phage gpG-like protein
MSVTLDAEALSAGLDRLSSQVSAAVQAKVTAATAELQRHVIDDKLHSQMLNARTGRLASAVERTIEVEGDSIVGEIFVNDSVRYAAILEHGGSTAPHDIMPDKTKALAFAAGGKHVFARVVHHPGSRFPARPYLASTLNDEAEEIAAALKSAAITAAQEAIG